MELFFGYLIMFSARIVIISLHTIRCLFSVRGRIIEASLMGFVQAALYVYILSLTLTSIDDPVTLFIYAAGFAFGTYVGSLLEERWGQGFCTVEMVCKECPPEEMANELRAAGFGVTILDGEGREGPTKLLFLTLEKKTHPRLMGIIKKKDPKAFITVLDARQARGGFMSYRHGKHK